MHGASAVTQAAYKLLIAHNISAIAHDVSPQAVLKKAPYHLGRFVSYAKIYLSLLTQKPNQVYISLSGGMGLYYDLVLIALARFKGAQLIFHHHSFAYIHKPVKIMRLICHLCRNNGYHIFLSPEMKADFIVRYGLETHGPDIQAWSLSNLAFFAQDKVIKPEKRHRLQTIGYLSNISFDKGIDRFLDILAKLRQQGSQIKGLIAGPYGSPEVKDYVQKRINEIGNIDYIGPVYDQAKTDFFAKCDYFIFPTRYANEAQPMVIFEAQLMGLPVAMSNRGCLGSMAADHDLLLDATSSQYDILVNLLLSLEKDHDAFQALSDKAFVRINDLNKQTASYRQAFLNLFKPV